MKSKYLIRLDDACSQMNKSRWQRMEAILDKYEIKPMVGIIPNNEDPVTCIDPIDPNFVVKALNWQKKGWAIALHGYNHICTTTIGGINPVHKRSEFAGISLSEQKEKISKGYKILVDMGLIPQYFFAPSHTFDRNTLKALAEETSIRIISDTIALYPYRLDEFAVIPCQMGRFRKLPLRGYWTFCFHPNGMDDVAFEAFENFVKTNQFISFSDIDISMIGKKSIADRLLSLMYFAIRKIKG
jgi:predicted deacetylase